MSIILLQWDSRIKITLYLPGQWAFCRIAETLPLILPRYYGISGSMMEFFSIMHIPSCLLHVMWMSSVDPISSDYQSSKTQVVYLYIYACMYVYFSCDVWFYYLQSQHGFQLFEHPGFQTFRSSWFSNFSMTKYTAAYLHYPSPLNIRSWEFFINYHDIIYHMHLSGYNQHKSL